MPVPTCCAVNPPDTSPDSERIVGDRGTEQEHHDVAALRERERKLSTTIVTHAFWGEAAGPDRPDVGSRLKHALALTTAPDAGELRRSRGRHAAGTIVPRATCGAAGRDRSSGRRRQGYPVHRRPACCHP